MKIIERVKSNLKNFKQSGTLHIASSLFFIFHDVMSVSKYVDQIRLPHRGRFVKYGKYVDCPIIFVVRPCRKG